MIDTSYDYVLIGSNAVPNFLNYSVFQDDEGINLNGDGSENNEPEYYLLDIYNIIETA